MLYSHAVKKADVLGVEPADRETAASWSGVWAVITISGIASALIAQLFPLRLFPGLPGFAYWLIPAGIYATNAWRRRRRTVADTPD